MKRRSKRAMTPSSLGTAAGAESSSEMSSSPPAKSKKKRKHDKDTSDRRPKQSKSSKGNSAVAAAQNALEHCDVCGENSEDAPTALSMGLEGACRRQCARCWRVWAPHQVIITWGAFKNKCKEYSYFLQKVSQAGKRLELKGVNIQRAHDSVGHNTSYGIKLSRPARFLQADKLHVALKGKATPRPLELGSPVKFEFGNIPNLEFEGFLAAGDTEAERGLKCEVYAKVRLDSSETLLSDAEVEGLAPLAISKALTMEPFSSSQAMLIEHLKGNTPSLKRLRKRAKQIQQKRKARRSGAKTEASDSGDETGSGCSDLYRSSSAAPDAQADTKDCVFDIYATDQIAC